MSWMRKQALHFVLALTLCLGLLSPCGTAFASGGQTSLASAYRPGTTMEIASAEDLMSFARQLEADRGIDAKLVADIDLSGQGVWTPMGGDR